MIICVGEILADLIGREHDGIFSYDRFAGGAPFNVACGLKKLGAACGFYGSVGDDLVGDFLISFAERQNFDFLEIRKDNERNTTLAFVELDKGGERRFSFYRKNTADYILQSATAEKIAKIADIVHIGSVPLSKEEGRAFADEQILRARAHGKKVSFDVNYREDLFAGAAEAAGVYRKYIENADIVKFSEDELTLFYPESTQEEALLKASAGGKTVFLTLGGKGSAAAFRGGIVRAETLRVRPVDTTGAGDAFFAGVLSALDEGETDLSRVLRRGNVCGALTTLSRGAVDAFPDKKTLEKALAEN